MAPSRLKAMVKKFRRDVSPQSGYAFPWYAVLR